MGPVAGGEPETGGSHPLLRSVVVLPGPLGTEGSGVGAGRQTGRVRLERPPPLPPVFVETFTDPHFF